MCWTRTLNPAVRSAETASARGSPRTSGSVTWTTRRASDDADALAGPAGSAAAGAW